MSHENLLDGPAPDAAARRRPGRRRPRGARQRRRRRARPSPRGTRRRRSRGRCSPSTRCATTATRSPRTRTPAPATTAGSTRCAGPGWRGHGPIPADHEPNQGFLRALLALARGGRGDRRGRRGRRAARSSSLDSGTSADEVARPALTRRPSAVDPDGPVTSRRYSGHCRPVPGPAPRAARHAGCRTAGRRGSGDPMPAVVVLGAQWGDEGKGKATDQLGSRIDYVVKFNGGNNAGPHGRHRRREVRAAPAAVGHPLARRRPGDRQRRRRRPRGAVRGDRRARGPRRRHLRACWSRRPRTSSRRTTARSTRSPSGSSASAGSAPPAAASARRTPTRSTASASASRTCSTRRSCAQKVEGALDQKNHLLVKVYNRRAITVDETVEELLRLRRAAAPDGRRHPAACSTTRSTRARPSCSRPVRRRCSTSTTAPTRSSRPRRRRPAARAPARASARRGSTAWSASSRRTRRASARARSRPSCSTTTASGCGRPAASSAPPRAARAAAAGTTPSSRATPAASTGSPTSWSPSSTCSPAWRRSRSCVAYDVDGRRFDEMPYDQRDFHHATPVYEYLDGWTEDISGAREFDDLPATAQRYVLRARGDLGHADLRRSASARAARRRSSGTTCSAELVLREAGVQVHVVPTVGLQVRAAPGPLEGEPGAGGHPARGGVEDRVLDLDAVQPERARSPRRPRRAVPSTRPRVRGRGAAASRRPRRCRRRARTGAG